VPVGKPVSQLDVEQLCPKLVPGEVTDERDVRSIGDGPAGSRAHFQAVAVPRLPQNRRERRSVAATDGEEPRPFGFDDKQAAVIAVRYGVNKCLARSEPAEQALSDELRVSGLQDSSDLRPAVAFRALLVGPTNTTKSRGGCSAPSASA